MCLSLAQLFLLFALMALTVVVQSFVADSSLLDCCDLVVVVLFLFFFSILCLQVGHRLGFGGGFSSFVFHFVSAVCMPD